MKNICKLVFFVIIFISYFNGTLTAAAAAAAKAQYVGTEWSAANYKLIKSVLLILTNETKLKKKKERRATNKGTFKMK